MDQLWGDLQNMSQSLLSKLRSIWSESPAGSIPLTGLLGVAALLAGIYHFRQNRRRGGPGDNRRSGQGGSGAVQTSGALGTSKPASSPSSSGPGYQDPAKPVPLEQVKSKLLGVNTVTISVPGVLLEEREPDQLEEGAAVLDDAAEIVKEIASCMPTYLMAQVSSDVGEAVVRGALEAAGVIGLNSRQVPPHRLILCETLGGKVAIVRQIEPELHIDGDHLTVNELQRFIPQQLHIFKQSGPLALGIKGIVGHGASLAEALNVAV